MKIYILLFYLFLIGCTKTYQTQDVLGIYTPSDFLNTFDTIELKTNNIFIRKVYDKNNLLVLKMKGNWTLEESNGLRLQSFFLNADNDLVEFPERAKDTSMSLYTNFEIQGGMIQFCTGSSDDDACYQKIK